MTVAGIISGVRLIDNTTPDAKLQTIATAGKVANSATTAASANTPSAIVARDGSGNFSAGTITATFVGDGSGLTSLAAGQLTAGTVPLARISGLTNAQLSGTAGITDANLAQITTAGKVANTATTADSGNTNSAIVARDGSGNFSTNMITIVGATTNPTDVATKAYVDAVASGLQVKAAVKLATTAALPANTYSSGAKTLTGNVNGALTVDGVAAAVADRILVQNEATAKNNGIYVVTAAGSGAAVYVLTRATDCDTSAEILSGMFVFTTAGTANAQNGYVLNTANPITLDTTSLSFTQFSGAGEITATNGLQKSGNTISILPDPTGGATIAVSGSGAKVAAASITNSQIAQTASILDAALAQITTAGKVANSATTATSAATNSAIIARDGAGRAQVTTPSVAADIATKGYVDAGGTLGAPVVGESPSGTKNGVNASFTLAHTPIAGSLELFLGFLRIEVTTHYTLSGATITMVAGFEPQTSESFLANYRW